MIDFSKEFAKYDFFHISENIELDINIDSLSNIKKNIKRIGREQNNVVIQIDDIHEILDKLNESIFNLNEINKLKKEFTIKEACFFNEKEEVINNLIEVLDEVENIIHFSKLHLNNSYSEQLNITWSQIGNIIKKIGLTRLDDIDNKFNAELNVATKVLVIDNKDDNTIIETLNSGYIYEKKIIRKSKVVVNKTRSEIIE
ncbi:MAG: nucleotide exchange factor GrpE [Clostridiales bacterium]